MKVAKKILKAITKSTVKVDLDSTSGDDDKYSVSFEINPFLFLSSDTKEIKGNKVLVFDDIERCKINIEELFGYINNFVEHLYCKVILIGDESTIEQLYDVEENELNKIHYKDFKEKLVGQTFLIKKNIDNAVEQFISDIQKNASEDYISLLELNISFIKELFEKTETHNLRILRQSFLDFNRFIEFLPDQYKKEKQYPLYIKSVLAYFLLTYCEYKNGNKNIVNFQNWSFRLGDDKDIYLKYDEKYNQFLSKNKIISLDQIISLQIISYYIENGVISELQRQDISLLQEELFTKKETTETWVQLQYYYELNNDDFNVLYKRVKNEFYKGKIDNISKLLHIVAVLLTIDNRNIVKLNRIYFVRKAKVHINTIIKEHKKISNQNILIPNKERYLSQFIATDDVEFSDIYKYVIDKNQEIKDTVMKEYFESITDQTILRLSKITSEGLPDRSLPY